MIVFSTQEYLRLFISALFYGLFFAIFEFCFPLIKFTVKRFFLSVYRSVFYKGKLTIKPFKLDEQKEKSEYRLLSNILSTVKIILFTIGFILLSYCLVMGEIRLFALIGAFLSYLLSSKFAVRICGRPLFKIINLIFAYFCIALRIIFYPLRVIILFFDKKCKFSKHLHKFCRLISIDNGVK